ncbi:MAG TPA: DUF4190 domain-containing protein [Intrasporangium sp.]|uniref:DUF4190 domain-containing protein n=1 Tax=Intrasporangium sp. TaxID=1925024 RepID=UPI002F92CB06
MPLPAAPSPVPADRSPTPGSNGLAIAALCCGLLGIFPIAAIAAIVLGIFALSQLQRRIQRGRGMAIAGIVLGGLWLVGWAVALVFAASVDQPTSAPPGAVAQQPSGSGSPDPSGSGSPDPSGAVTPDSSAPVTQEQETFVNDLKAGDCFSYTGGKGDEVDLVTVTPCASPHEAQVVITFELPDGAYPGEDKVIDAADKGCTDKGDPLLTDRAYENLDPAFFYPDSFTWRGDRTVICVVEAPSGTTTGTALK